MPYDPQIHHRRSIRLKGYDYSQAGAYFVTIVAHNRECVFGEIINDSMRSNPFGEWVTDWWFDIPRHFPDTDLDAFVLMPNHLHGIIIIPPVEAGSPRPVTSPPPHAGRGNRAPTTTAGNTGMPNRSILGKIVAYFKYQSAKQINAERQTPGAALWQRNYFEHIIRNDSSLDRIRQYIETNPMQWSLDDENPNRSAHPR